VKTDRFRALPARRLAAGAALLLTVALGGCFHAVPDSLTAVRNANIRGAAPEGDVELPHLRPRVEDGGHVDYELTLPAGVPPKGVGIFVTVSNVPFAASVNGVPVFQNGDGGSLPIPYSSWRASPWFRIPPSALSADRNELTLRAFNRPGAAGVLVLGDVLVGPPDDVERWWIAQVVLHHGLPVLIGAALIGVGLIALSFARGRSSDRFLFLLMACGTILWGLQNLVQQMPFPLLAYPHQSVLLISLYVWYPMLLSVFYMRFVYSRSTNYEKAAAMLAALTAPVLYLGVAYGHFGTASIVVRSAAILLILIAASAVARYAIRERTVVSVLLILAVALAIGGAVRDYLVSAGPTQDGRPLWLTAYSGLGLIVLAIWILIERYHRAFAAVEASSIVLEARVTEASAELARRLRQVQAAREQAEQANAAKSRFLAAASHDLRQPLHSLGLFAAALEGHATSREARELVTRIGDSIGALERLFNELLDMSKLDAHAVAVHPRNFALQELFDRLSHTFHAEAVERNLRLRFMPTALAVRTDPVLLERVLVNLVANALRYTQEGGVVIGARARGLEVWIDVVDSGIGIPVEKQQQVFDEFFQVDNPGRDRRRGLGLGLAIVRRLVGLMGHRISLRSVPGRGTRFRLTLLRAKTVEVEPALLSGPAIEPFRGRRVLLVDDDPDIRHATVQLLEQWGMTVAACRGREEFEALNDGGFVPEIALVDLRLDSVDDGVEVIELLRRRHGAGLPALLLSGDTGAAELARVRASGLPLLTKPVSPARLKSALHGYLGAGPAELPSAA
jgi:signal transduction histidine kinase/ActR/RegA family two-component response regulator